VFAIQFEPILSDITSTEYIYELDLQNCAQSTRSGVRIVYFGQYCAKNGVFITEYCHLHPLKLDTSAISAAIGEDHPKISVNSRTWTLKMPRAKKKSVRLMSPLSSRGSLAKVGSVIIYRCPRATVRKIDPTKFPRSGNSCGTLRIHTSRSKWNLTDWLAGDL